MISGGKPHGRSAPKGAETKPRLDAPGPEELLEGL
jgi:hypothetical protein